MNVWIVEIGEPLPGIDLNVRDWRCGMLSKALIAAGHEVTWWASTFDHATKRHRFDGPRVVETQPGLQVRLLHGPGYSRNASSQRLQHHRAVASAFAQFAAALSKPDMVFCCLPTLELAGQAVSYGHRRRVPVVVDVRDLWPDHYLTLVPVRWRKLFKLALALEFRRAHWIMRGATGLTAISDTFLNWALKMAGRERRASDGVFALGYPVFQLSLDVVQAKQMELRAQYGLRPDDLIVTFVGTFVSSFDLETVIRAARVLEQHGQSDVWFVLVGEGDYGATLRARAHGLNRVIFTGWFDQLSVAAMLGLSSIGLAPYRADASMSLPNKPFEYMAAGLPLLSSLRGELAGLLQSERIGWQYQAGDADSLVKQIHWLAAHPEERKAAGCRARNLFEERFSAHVIYPRLVQHLERIAGQ